MYIASNIIVHACIRNWKGEREKESPPVRGELRRSSFVAMSTSGSFEMGTHTSVAYPYKFEQRYNIIISRQGHQGPIDSKEEGM